MRRWTIAVACAVVFSAAAHLSAQPTVVTINGNPLTVIVGSDTSFQLVNSQFPGNGQFYPGGCTSSVADAGIFASINGTLYGPDFNSHPCGTAANQPTPWTPVSISGVLGSGTLADPYRIVVTVAAGTTGVQLTATFSYVNGNGFYRLTKTFCSGPTPVARMNVYLGGDIYLAGSDSGIPYLEPTSQSPGGSDCSNTGYKILLVPTTPADFYTARNFATVWNEISTQGDLSDLVDTGCIDNGAALEWKRALAANSCFTITSASSFGPVPAIATFSVGSVTPNQGAQGQTMTVTVSGIGFQSGTTFNFGPGITVNSTVINSSSQATLSITIAPAAPTGPHDVTGTQSAGGPTNTATGAFTVTGTTPPTACPTAPTGLTPSGSGAPTRGVLRWAGSAPSYNVYFGQGTSGCSTLAGTTTSPVFAYSNLQPNATYVFRVEAVAPGCPTVSSSCVSFTTGTPCPTQPPTLLSPVPGATNVASPVTFTWSAVRNATSYTLYVSENNQPYRNAGTTTGTELRVDVAQGPISWFVIATFPCGTARSAFSSFNALPPVPSCGSVDVPIPAAVALIRSGEKYHVIWPAVDGADSYEVDVSTSPGFGNAQTIVTNTPSVVVQQTFDAPTAVYYRVRSRNTPCNVVSANSRIVRTVVVPEDPPTLSSFSLATELGSTHPVSQHVQVGGTTGPAAAAVQNFVATTDRPWLTVTPQTGTLPVTFTVTADPTGLQAGSTTGTLIVRIVTTASDSTPATTVPISISLATPVAPSDKTMPSQNSLIVPAVAHVDGQNSVWRSDVRLANVGGAPSTYRLLLSLSAPAGVTVREGSVDVTPGSTIALDDIVKNWFGFGPLGDGANGVLEIRPGDPALPRFNTAASSRTYNVTPNGTLGQFIPAVPYTNFLASGAGSLVLQPISQSEVFRTNFGVVEGAGQPANVTANFFDANGNKILSQTFAMKGGDQLQLGSLLAQNGLAVTDGWADVTVDSASGGKITAYASVIDSRTGDGSVIVGTNTLSASTRYVVAGVGKTSAGTSNWQSDLTLLNRGPLAVDATLTFVQQGSSTPQTAQVHIDPGQNKILNDVIASTFGVSNALGAIIVDTPSASQLVVDARTYDVEANGTVGQSLPAFTAENAVSANGRALQLLNIEESERYRSNLGLMEVSGHPATVEVTGFSADSKVTPTITLDLAPNQFVQMSRILAQLGFDRTYNGRVSVSVVGGSGSVVSYISTVDNKTDDPTYIPAQ